jgi:alpha-mannosidase
LRYAVLYDIPARMNRARTRRTRRQREVLAIMTDVTLWAGLPRVDFHVAVDNFAEDHRLRALFPAPFAVARIWSENQFHVASRELEPPPWNGESPEQPPTTFPQKTFAAIEGDGAGIAVFNRGLQEGEVVRDGSGREAYALTLLRCVGWLSRPDLASRRGGAGPTIATADSQMPGTHMFDYGLTTYRGNWREANVQAMAHGFAHPPIGWYTNEHEGSASASLPLAVFSPETVVPSAMHRSDEDGAPILRVFNGSDEATVATVWTPEAGPGAGLVDLMEQPRGEPAGAGPGWSFRLRPWEIGSVRFGRRE